MEFVIPGKAVFFYFFFFFPFFFFSSLIKTKDPHQNDEDVMRGGDRTRTPLTPCPVFYPTAEEFADPLAYISGIADVVRVTKCFTLFSFGSFFYSPGSTMGDLSYCSSFFCVASSQNTHPSSS